MYTLLIVFFLLSIVFSFLCSVWEAVLLSIPPSFVEIKHQQSSLLGQRLKKFKDNIDQPLSAILTLNTIAHTVGAIGVGVQAGKIWGESFMASVVTPVAMTLAILILSEIIPKTIGATYWKKLVPFTTTSLHYIILLLYPLVWFSQLITKWLKKGTTEAVLSRADFNAMATLGAKKGIIQKGESKIIQNLLRFNTIRAADIMTPRTVVVAASEKQNIREFYEKNKNLRFSRIPIYSESKDHITGFVLKDELLSKLLNDEHQLTMKDIKRPISIIQEDLALPELFNQLMERREHISLVMDKYGGMAGIVTMEDVIETLLGMEIIDELDNIADMQLLARRNWEKRARQMGLITDPPAQNSI